MKKILTVFLLVFSCFLMAKEVAIFTKTQGEVYTSQYTLKNRKYKGDLIENNSTISTNADSYALINYTFTNGTVRVFPNSAVKVTCVDSLTTKVSLNQGKILNDLKEMIKGTYTVETTSTVASVRGTAFEVLITDEGTDINVVSGKVDVLNKISGQTHSLGANQRLISRNSGELIELTPTGEPLPAESEEIENKDESSSKSTEQSSNNFKLPTLASPNRPTTAQANTQKPEEKVEKKGTAPAKTPAKEEMKAETSEEASYPIAVVLKVKGDLTLIRDAKELSCPVGTLLETNDKLRTDDKSLALVKFVDNSSQIRVFSNSEVIIVVDQEKASLNKSLKLEAGSVLSHVNKKIVGKYSVSTTSTIASVRGTEFLVELKDGITTVTGFSGKVEVENKISGKKSLVTKGSTVTSFEDGEIDRQKTEEIPPEVNEELESTEYENSMRINFENEDGSIKTIILEY